MKKTLLHLSSNENIEKTKTTPFIATSCCLDEFFFFHSVQTKCWLHTNSSPIHRQPNSQPANHIFDCNCCYSVAQLQPHTNITKNLIPCTRYTSMKWLEYSQLPLKWMWKLHGQRQKERNEADKIKRRTCISWQEASGPCDLVELTLCSRITFSSTHFDLTRT